MSTQNGWIYSFFIRDSYTDLMNFSTPFILVDVMCVSFVICSSQSTWNEWLLKVGSRLMLCHFSTCHAIYVIISYFSNSTKVKKVHILHSTGLWAQCCSRPAPPSPPHCAPTLLLPYFFSFKTFLQNHLLNVTPGNVSTNREQKKKKTGSFQSILSPVETRGK